MTALPLIVCAVAAVLLWRTGPRPIRLDGIVWTIVSSAVFAFGAWIVVFAAFFDAEKDWWHVIQQLLCSRLPADRTYADQFDAIESRSANHVGHLRDKHRGCSQPRILTRDVQAAKGDRSQGILESSNSSKTQMSHQLFANRLCVAVAYSSTKPIGCSLLGSKTRKPNLPWII